MSQILSLEKEPGFLGEVAHSRTGVCLFLLNKENMEYFIPENKEILKTIRVSCWSHPGRVELRTVYNSDRLRPADEAAIHVFLLMMNKHQTDKPPREGSVIHRAMPRSKWQGKELESHHSACSHGCLGPPNSFRANIISGLEIQAESLMMRRTFLLSQSASPEIFF